MGIGTAIEAEKRCTTCERLLPLDNFYVKERRDDGTAKRLFGACRRCRNARVRARVVRRVDAEPLRQWMAARLQIEGVWDQVKMEPVPFHRAPRSIDMIARDWGTSAKRVQELLKGRVQTITEDYADRVLTGAGSPHLLGIMYPDDADEIAA